MGIIYKGEAEFGQNSRKLEYAPTLLRYKFQLERA